jgi:hypothetical protein
MAENSNGLQHAFPTSNFGKIWLTVYDMHMIMHELGFVKHQSRQSWSLTFNYAIHKTSQLFRNMSFHQIDGDTQKASWYIFKHSYVLWESCLFLKITVFRDVTSHNRVGGSHHFRGLSIFLVELREPTKDLTWYIRSPGLDMSLGLPNMRQEHYLLNCSVWCVQVKETGMTVQKWNIWY